MYLARKAYKEGT